LTTVERNPTNTFDHRFLNRSSFSILWRGQQFLLAKRPYCMGMVGHLDHGGQVISRSVAVMPADDAGTVDPFPGKESVIT
jgi:hypothetical protein